jgi:hypothetical protein
VLRARRRASHASIAIVLVVSSALVVTAMANPDPDRRRSTITASASSCPTPSTATGDIPSWAASARPPKGVPHLLSHEQNVVGFVFGYPLRAGHPKQRANKILFVMRAKRDGQPLRVTGTLAGRRGSTHVSVKGDASPGEIYPSVIDVPVPGCWHFVLSWNGHRATINLAYRRA